MSQVKITANEDACRKARERPAVNTVRNYVVILGQQERDDLVLCCEEQEKQCRTMGGNPTLSPEARKFWSHEADRWSWLHSRLVIAASALLP